MKKNIFLFFVFISIFTISSCCANWTPGDFWNIKISPATVKRGEEITITYDYRASDGKDFIEYLFLDENGNLQLPEKEKKEFEQWRETPKENYNDFVVFNTKIRDGAKKYKTNHAENCTSIDYECGGEKISIDYDVEDYELSNVFPAKYISFETGKIICTVPDNAVSGVIFLSNDFISGGVFSEEKLIIVDENGNEITE